jgi:hypothetical protein
MAQAQARRPQNGIPVKRGDARKGVDETQNLRYKMNAVQPRQGFKETAYSWTQCS